MYISEGHIKHRFRKSKRAVILLPYTVHLDTYAVHRYRLTLSCIFHFPKCNETMMGLVKVIYSNAIL